MPADLSIEDLSATIKQKALELGFTACGYSRAEALPEDKQRLRAWLDQGYHAGMAYMAGHFGKRCDPTLLVEGARTVISLLYSYHSDSMPQDAQAPLLSKYAYGTDYHFVLKDKLHLLFAFIKSLDPETRGRVFVDSAPVLDRAWARRAGLGWIGKNSMLISRSAGSFVFIGEIILDMELAYTDLPESDFCGSCNRCLEACPTGAILDTRTIDSERCISYQTIENRGEISPEIEARLSGRVFGCDICQDVCPWNRKAGRHSEPAFDARPGLLAMSAGDWQDLDPEKFEKLFHRSAVQRAGYEKIKATLASLQKNNDPGAKNL